MGVTREREVDEIMQECALRFSYSPGILGSSPPPLSAGFCVNAQLSVLAPQGSTHLPQSGLSPPARIEIQVLISSRKKRRKRAIILHILKALQPW